MACFGVLDKCISFINYQFLLGLGIYSNFGRLKRLLEYVRHMKYFKIRVARIFNWGGGGQTTNHK